MKSLHRITIAAAIAIALVSCQQPTQQAAVCVTTNPQPGLWPHVNWPPQSGCPTGPCFRPGVETALADIPKPLDVGAIRPPTASGGCYEIMWQHNIWRAYNPATDIGVANKFSRYGRGWSLGHTSDDAFSFAPQYEEVYGRTLPYEGQEFVDYEYNRAMRQDLQKKWCALPAQVGNPACGYEPTTPLPTPTPGPTPLPTPTAQPTATPAPTPAPTPCPQFVAEPIPPAVLATINQGLNSIGRNWQSKHPGWIERTRAWLVSHQTVYMPKKESH